MNQALRPQFPHLAASNYQRARIAFRPHRDTPSQGWFTDWVGSRLGQPRLRAVLLGKLCPLALHEQRGSVLWVKRRDNPGAAIGCWRNGSGRTSTAPGFPRLHAPCGAPPTSMCPPFVAWSFRAIRFSGAAASNLNLFKRPFESLGTRQCDAPRACAATPDPLGHSGAGLNKKQTSIL